VASEGRVELDGAAAARAAACAAVVLYRPDPALLARQVEGLRGVRFLAFANGPLAPEALAALAPANLHLSFSPDNLGLAAGLNAVMAQAMAEGFAHVLLLDQDSEPTTDLLASLVACAQGLAARGERAAVVAPRMVPPAEGHYKPLRYEWRGRSREDGLAPVDFAPTSGSLASVAAFREVGPFRDDFFIGGIDVEWGFRAWSRGWGSYVAPGLEMPHRWGEAVDEDEAGTPQILRHAPIRNYYYARNVVATARLPHVPLSWRLKSCAILFAQSALLLWKGGRVAFRPVLAGLRNGVRMRLGPAPATLKLG